MLTEFNALITTRFAASSVFTMFRLDSFPVWAVVVIVVNVSMFWWIFLRVCVVRSYLRHWNPLSLRQRR